MPDLVMKNKNTKALYVLSIPEGVDVKERVAEWRSLSGEAWELDSKTEPADVPEPTPAVPATSKGN